MHNTESSPEWVADESEMYRTVFELSTIGKILVERCDANTFIVLDANEAAARYGKWEGFGHKDIVGKNLPDVFDGLKESGLLDKYNEALDVGELVSLGELIYGDSNVPEGVFRVDLVPLKQERLLISYENITQKHLAEKQIQKANEDLTRLNSELDAFAYVASHDLKSPLRAIDNLANWVIEDLGEDIPKDSKRHLRLMRERIARLEGFLDDLLQYSRVGRFVYEVESISVGDLVQEIIDLHSDADMHFEVATDLPAIQTPKPPFQQVLHNLIGNAIKYHDKVQGKVSVGWQDEGHVYRFWVADDGPGIAPEFHERIFQMFQKLQSRDEVEGSGIGLALVKKAVENYGGNMTLTSDVGMGAHFEFTWPKNIQPKGAE